MKVLTLQLNGKKYATTKITAYMSKEALKIQKDALDLAKSGKAVQEDSSNLDAVGNLLDQLFEIKDRKVALICDIYGNKFTADEIEKILSDEEIDAQMAAIVMGIAGVASKNG